MKDKAWGCMLLDGVYDYGLWQEDLFINEIESMEALSSIAT